MSDERDYWDEAAATFDDEPDHGLLDPDVRAAWAALLLPLVSPAPADVLDLGCGTGSLAVLLAEAGHAVRGVDFSKPMVAAARRKARTLPATFVVGDASDPPFEEGSADVVLARHVLWALPDRADAVGRWIRLLRPGGRLVLIEGEWSTGTGVTSRECEAIVRHHGLEAELTHLDESLLWGGPIDDERYLVIGSRP
jgi:ubiquinone/menaquinone biosynthesis C-methylase UbiE